MRHIIKIGIGVAYLAPLAVFAQEEAATLGDVLTILGGLLNTAIPLVVALALLFFFWGLASFLLNAGDETARATARQQMIYGIIVLFVIVAVWGLVQILAQTFGIETGGSSGTLPSIEGLGL